MNPLHRLPNGEWTDLTEIRHIKTDSSEGFCVMVLGVTMVTLGFEGRAEAHAYADELAALVNAAREGDAA